MTPRPLPPTTSWRSTAKPSRGATRSSAHSTRSGSPEKQKERGQSRIQKGHGDAERLVVEDVDLRRFDEVVASGDLGEELTRTVLANNFLGPKRFGKMFPDLEPFRPPDDALRNLGRAMREAAPGDPALNLSSIPAGFTYLGQFVDHDITFDQTVGFPEIDDPEEIEQARTPTLDLDSLYGLGPRRQPELYDQGVRPSRAPFKIGLTSSTPSS